AGSPHRERHVIRRIRGFPLMTAIALMKTVRAPFHLQLFDPNSSVSGGQALASVRSSTILNTRVRDLSVSVGDNDDFNDWLCS
ncbi:FAD/NAD(P)-binding protein, partial [Rhizobium ruizarguesonis]